MKRVAFSAFSALLLASGCAVDEVKHTAQEERVLHEEITTSRVVMENEFLSLSLFPELSGGVQNVVWKKDNLPLLCGGKYVRISEGPLRVRPAATGVLFYEKFWAASNVGLTAMEVKKQSDNYVELFAPIYDIQPASLTRKITLAPNSLIVNFEVELLLQPGTRYVSTNGIRPWLNLLTSKEIQWQVAIPGKGGNQVNGMGQKTDFPATGIYRTGAFGPNTFFTPARNWVAVSSKENNISLALIHDVKKSCTIYSWYGLHEGKTARTIEFIFPDPAAKLTGDRRYSYRMAIFPGIGDLREICQDTAIEPIREDGKLTLRFSPARVVKGQTLSVKVAANGKTIALKGTDAVPELKPGKLFDAVFELPSEFAKGEISVTWGENTFTLLEEVNHKK